MSNVTADQQAAAAVVRHHAQLAQELNSHLDRLLETVERGSDVSQARQDLSVWLAHELVPHALAEEKTLYPAAAAMPRGALLIDGMLSEHRSILDLVEEIETASSPIRAAAAARAVGALFANHLAKENDLVLGLLVAAEEVSVADLLEGMHALLGGHAAGGGHDTLTGSDGLSASEPTA